MREYQPIAGDIERLHLPSYCDQRRDDILNAPDFNGDKLDAEVAGGNCELLNLQRGLEIADINQHRDPTKATHGLV